MSRNSIRKFLALFLCSMAFFGSGAAEAQGGRKPASAKCFKQVFSKKQKKKEWTIRKCSEETVQKFQIELFEGGNKVRRLDLDYGDGSAVNGINYKLVSDSTLILDLVSGSGGDAYIVHPNNSGKLMAFKFHYETGKNGSLSVKQNGKKILASTDKQKINFEITEAGDIVRAVSAEKAEENVVTLPVDSVAKCHIEEKGPNGSQTHYLEIVTKDGAIDLVKYKGTSVSGEEGGAFSCEFEVSKVNKNAKFSKDGKVTTIQFTENGRPSVIKITEENEGFAATFDNLDQSSYCGAGAQIPKGLILADGQCKAQF